MRNLPGVGDPELKLEGGCCIPTEPSIREAAPWVVREQFLHVHFGNFQVFKKAVSELPGMIFPYSLG